MCDGPQQPANVGEALVMLDRALDALNGSDAGSPGHSPPAQDPPGQAA
jgi:hypothetical protein